MGKARRKQRMPQGANDKEKKGTTVQGRMRAETEWREKTNECVIERGQV
jgi:hypothetical protein